MIGMFLEPIRKTIGTILCCYGVYQIMVLAGWRGIYTYHGAKSWWSWPVFILLELVVFLSGLALILGMKTMKRIMRRLKHETENTPNA